MNYKQEDIKYINRCFELAKRGSGFVSPNPLVGAVLVKDDRIIAEGFHGNYGRPHAEVNAFNNAVEDTEGAVLYCNLEPCSHSNKKTPPCTPLVISKKIKRLVISNIDPNPEVSGKGIEQIRNAGIEVTIGVLEEEGKELNKFFFKYIKEKIPYVTVKIAQTLDGKINFDYRKQTWITGEESAGYVHRLRSEYDAVLVGANTVNIDNPRLTVRHVKGRNPKKVILDGKLSTSPLSEVYDENCILFTSESSSFEKLKIFHEKGVKVFTLPENEDKSLNASRILEILGDEKFSSLLIEGGGVVFSRFISQKLFDEIILLTAPKIFGKGLEGFKDLPGLKLNTFSVEKLGEDIKTVYKK